MARDGVAQEACNILVVRMFPHHGRVIAGHLNDFQSLAEHIAPAEAVIGIERRAIFGPVGAEQHASAVQPLQTIRSQRIRIQPLGQSPVHRAAQRVEQGGELARIAQLDEAVFQKSCGPPQRPAGNRQRDRQARCGRARSSAIRDLFELGHRPDVAQVPPRDLVERRILGRRVQQDYQFDIAAHRVELVRDFKSHIRVERMPHERARRSADMRAQRRHILRRPVLQYRRGVGVVS